MIGDARKTIRVGNDGITDKEMAIMAHLVILKPEGDPVVVPLAHDFIVRGRI